jgi:glucokinase
MKNYVAVDIGGTQIRVAVYPEEGILPIQQERIPTVSSREKPLDRMMALIQRLWPGNASEVSIGSSSPGFIDSVAGLVISAPNISGWDHLPVVALVHEHFGVPVYLGNDANLALLGEFHFGNGQGVEDILYLTISTGIGGGILAGGRLLEGAHGIAAELGHILADPAGPVCGCGKRGHLEALASGPAISRYVVEQVTLGRRSLFTKGMTPNAREIADAASQGDEVSIEAYNRAGYFIGRTLADLLHILNPSLVILGGGVSLSGDLLLDPLRKSLQEHVVSAEYLHDLVITTARLGDDAGLLGALAWLKEKEMHRAP